MNLNCRERNGLVSERYKRHQQVGRESLSECVTNICIIDISEWRLAWLFEIILGVSKDVFDKTVTGLESSVLVAYSVHVVLLNISRGYKTRQIQYGHILVEFFPSETKMRNSLRRWYWRGSSMRIWELLVQFTECWKLNTGDSKYGREGQKDAYFASIYAHGFGLSDFQWFSEISCYNGEQFGPKLFPVLASYLCGALDRKDKTAICHRLSLRAPRFRYLSAMRYLQQGRCMRARSMADIVNRV